MDIEMITTTDEDTKENLWDFKVKNGKLKLMILLLMHCLVVSQMRQKKWKMLLTQKNSKKRTGKSRVNTRALRSPLTNLFFFAMCQLRGFKPKNGLKSSFSKSVHF